MEGKKDVFRVYMRVGLYENEDVLGCFEVPNNERETWRQLCGATWKKGDLCLPKDHFHYNMKVPDVVLAEWRGNEVVWNENAHSFPAIGGQQESIVVLLESPHRHEYVEEGQGFIPGVPLSNSSSRTRFRNQIQRLIGEARDLLGIELHGRYPIILCNPIQFQTSLDNLFGRTGKLKPEVRNRVWRALWRHAQGGRYPFQEEFQCRMRGYNPVLILNACTSKLKREVHDFLNSNFSGRHVSTYHPSVWGKGTAVVLNKAKGR